MPLVTVPLSPSGEPIATTVSPTWTPEELPRVAAFSPDAPSSLIRARSFLLSVPTTFAVYVLPLLVVTLIDEAPEMTWLLVTISPPLVMITPEPVEEPLSRVALISTTLGLTAAAMVATSPFLPAGTTLVVVLLVATVSLPVSSWKAYAVPPPIAAATIATAASRASGPRVRFFGAGAPGSTTACCTGGCAGGGGHSGFTGEEACCGAPCCGFP